MNVKLCQVSKKYSGKVVFDRVSEELPGGELVALLGLNGAGKTTLLRILAGLCGYSSGRVLFDEEVFKRDDVGQRKRLMFMPDVPVLFMGWTVLENIAWMLKMWDAECEDAEVIECCRRIGLLPEVNSPLHQLSRGMYYKVGLVCLQLVDADLCLIDEPFASGMDHRGIEFFKKYARDATARGKTVVFTTQMFELVDGFADQVWLIHGGGIVKGSPEELVASGDLDKVFGLELE